MEKIFHKAFIACASIFLFLSFAHSKTELQDSPVILFNEGINLKDHPSRIRPGQSPDMQNFICDDQSSYIRNGTRRYNTTAISTNPVNSLYRAYSSAGKKMFIAASEDEIYVSTYSAGAIAEDVFLSTYIWRSTYTLSASDTNSKFSFATYNDEVIMVNGSTNPLKYDIAAGSVSVLGGSPPRAKFVLISGEYTLMARTTDFPNRIYYSNIGNSESWPTNNTIDLNSITGESITGMTNTRNGALIFMENSIWVVNFTVLSSGSDGDQVVSQLTDKIGCIAPYGIADFGDGIFFPARDGFRLFLKKENIIISDEIQPIVINLIKSGKYKNIVSLFDKKNKWIWVSYEDDSKYPKGVNNSVLIYDLHLKQWYPQAGIYANSFCIWDGPGDNNELWYGQSNDGYVFEMDKNTLRTDARLEKYLISFDVAAGDTITTRTDSPLEGDNYGVIFSSNTESTNVNKMTGHIGNHNLSQYFNSKDSTINDELQFYFRRPTANTTSFMVSLYFEGDTTSNNDGGDRYRFSITTGLPAVNTWQQFSIPLINFSSYSGTGIIQSSIRRILETITLQCFAGTNSECHFDDFRIISSTRAAIDAYRSTPQLDFNLREEKNLSNAYLNAEIGAETTVNITNIGDFGKNRLENTIDKAYENVLYISSGNTLTMLNKDNFSVLRTSSTGNIIDYLFRSPETLYGVERASNAVIKINHSSLTLISRTTTFANGDTFNQPHGICRINDDIFVADTFNDRIVKFKTDSDSNMIFVSSSLSSLGLSSPTAVVSDGKFVYAVDALNLRILKLDIDMNFIKELFINNEVKPQTDSTDARLVPRLVMTEKYLICAYRRTSPYFSFSEYNGSYFQIIDRVNFKFLKEIPITRNTRYAAIHDINADNKYLFAASSYVITAIGNPNPLTLQQYNIDDLSFVREVTNKGPISGLATIGYYVPNQTNKIPVGLKGRYLQMIFSVDKPGDFLRLNDLRFNLFRQELR